MSTLYRFGELLSEAVDYASEAFDNDTEVNGADLVEWFADWRGRVQATLLHAAKVGGHAD